MGESQLGSTKMKLQMETQLLQKAFRMAKNEDEERSQQVKMDCDRLRQGTKQLTAMVALLHRKTDQCETVMGSYTGKEYIK